MATDIFGHSFANNQVNADEIASKTGVLVVIPDLFNNEAVAVETMTKDQETRTAVSFHLIFEYLKIRRLWVHGSLNKDLLIRR